MLFVRRQYDAQAEELLVRDDLVFDRPASRAAGRDPGQRHQPGGRPGGDVRQVARDGRCAAVFVTTDSRRPRSSASAGSASCRACRWCVVESPYRALVGPVVTYLDVLERAWPPDQEAPTTIVVLPEYVARHWWDRLLYNQTAKRLKAALVGREHTVIADVPYRRERDTSRRRVCAAPRARCSGP